MSSLTFPSLHDTPLEAFSPLLTRLYQNMSNSGLVTDQGRLLKGFLQQYEAMANVHQQGNLRYEALRTRSAVLRRSIQALASLGDDDKDPLEPSTESETLQGLLPRMTRVYAHPLLTSLWLGLEHVVHISDTEAEKTLYYQVHGSAHHPSQVANEAIDVFTALRDWGNTEPALSLLDATSQSQVATIDTLRHFIETMAPVVFAVAASGHRLLTVATVTTLNHVMTWLNNLRMQNHYKKSVGVLYQLRQPRAPRQDAICAMNAAVFDGHIPCGKVRMNVDDPAYATGTIVQPKSDLHPSLQSIYQKLKANAELIMAYRGRLTTSRTRRFLKQLTDLLTDSQTLSIKAHHCQCIIVDWQRWMTLQFGDGDVLMQECGSLGAALIAQLHGLEEE